MQFPYGITVQRLPYEPGATDGRGNTIDAWGSPVTITGVAFDPGSSQEPSEPGRDAVETRPRLFIPSGTVVTAQDRFIVGEKTFTVEGDPNEFESPFTGSDFPTEVNLRRVSG